MDIYRTAYWVRQVEALRELFPSIVEALGDGPFARTASRYLQAHPSRSHAIEHIGLAFPGWLAQTNTVLGEAASIDWLRWSVFVAPDEARLAPSAVQPATLETLCVRVGAHVAATQVSSESLALALPRLTCDAPAVLAKWREGFDIRHMLIDADEARTLRASREGLEFPEWCEALLGDAPADAAGAQSVFTTPQRLAQARLDHHLESSMKHLVFTLSFFAFGCGAPEPTCDVPNTYALGGTEPRGPTMRPGQNCLRCHSVNGEAKDKVFSFGGTIFPTADAGACEGVSGVTVRVTDSEGTVVTTVSNSVGNFWSTTPLKPPLRIQVERAGRVATMPGTTPTGGCALCHSWPDAVSARGRIRAP